MSKETPYREKEWFEHYPLHQIWCNEHLPLVPRIRYRPADEYNAWSFGFHWLFFHIWTLTNFSFCFDIDISLSRIGIGFCLPYLRVFLGINHFYTNATWKISRFLSRDPKQ